MRQNQAQRFGDTSSCSWVSWSLIPSVPCVDAITMELSDCTHEAFVGIIDLREFTEYENLAEQPLPIPVEYTLLAIKSPDTTLQVLSAERLFSQIELFLIFECIKIPLPPPPLDTYRVMSADECTKLSVASETHSRICLIQTFIISQQNHKKRATDWLLQLLLLLQVYCWNDDLK